MSLFPGPAHPACGPELARADLRDRPVAGSSPAPGTVEALTDEHTALPLQREPAHLPGTKPRSRQDHRPPLGTQTGPRVPRERQGNASEE